MINLLICHLQVNIFGCLGILVNIFFYFFINFLKCEDFLYIIFLVYLYNLSIYLNLILFFNNVNQIHQIPYKKYILFIIYFFIFFFFFFFFLFIFLFIFFFFFQVQKKYMNLYIFEECLKYKIVLFSDDIKLYKISIYY
jgi:hypothetical protein